MQSFKDTLAAHRRLAFLRFLYASPNYTLNTHIIKQALNEAGYLCNDVNVHDDVFQLSLHSCIDVLNVNEADSSLQVLKLTSVGEDVARGVSVIDGIKRPSPSDNLPDLPF